MIPQTQRKLREAQFFFNHLRDRAGDLPLDAENLGHFLSAFLSAARSVTFALQVEEKENYDAWFPGWKARLNDRDKGLLTFMNRQRTAEIHTGGSAVASSVEYRKVSQIRAARDDGGWRVIFTAPPGAPPPEIGFAAHHFEIGDDLIEVRAACKRYIELLEQLVAEFKASHE